MIHRFYYLVLIALVFSLNLSAQNGLPYTLINLENMDEFKPAGKNWMLAKDVFYDLKEGGQGKIEQGTGILVNDPSGKSKDHLFTRMEHGDIEVELDFMMDKGSNAGIYLQGRYEIQMFDSWGEKHPKVTDNGAIYQRWDESKPEGERGYQGHPPAQNLSKAPGLWQHYQIIFKAPRFDEKGKKIANARFVKVVHNGITIHENTELLGPTRAAAFNDEQPLGPLMIQGDHGPVAIRNIRYKMYSTDLIQLSDLQLNAFEGKFNALSELSMATPSKVTDIKVLEHASSGSKDNFGGRITGKIHLPSTGAYLFKLSLGWIPQEVNLEKLNGGAELLIGKDTVLNMDGSKGGIASTTINLIAGDYPFVLTYYKKFDLWYARSNDIQLAAEGPGVAFREINSRGPEVMYTPSSIKVLAGNGPVMQRSFVNHSGKKKTHVISVGEPSLTNFSYDLRKGALLQFWRGDFLEASGMWAGRGEEQLAVPLGSVIEVTGKPDLAFLQDKNSVWPDSNAVYNYQGYDIQNHLPVFKYTLGDLTIKEFFESEENGNKLSHTIQINPGADTNTNQLWCKVAEGSRLQLLPNGLYAVNDKQFYLQLSGKEKPVIRTTNHNTQELLLPLSKLNVVKYSIIW